MIGDWKTHFDRDARVQFHAYAGDALIHLGYEHDDSWVHSE